jgi:5-methylcytosine-specific restriction endonuclease McrA
MKTKLCKTCKQDKPLDDFAKHPNTKDRLANTCKPCAKELSKYYRSVNADAYRERDRIRNATPERKEQSRQWETANRDKRREQERVYDAANRDIVNAKMREWRKNNPEKEKSYCAKWKGKNLEYVREKSKVQSVEYRKNNPDKVIASTHRYRKRVKENGGVFTGSQWAAIKELFRYQCLMCGKPEPIIKLSPDHVIPISKGGKNCASNIQPLCRKCNRIKSDGDTDYRIDKAQLIAGYAVKFERILKECINGTATA